MKKLLAACAVSAVAIAPAAAAAQEPKPADFRSAAKYCKALKEFSGGSNFAAMFGTRKNAYGKCVSQTARQTAREDAAQEKAAKANAAKECEAMKTQPQRGNAFGKCVSEKARQHKAAADAEDKAEQQDRLNAAQTCRQAKRDDAAQFEKDYGSARNAFGKCVSKTARENAEQRRQQRQATP